MSRRLRTMLMAVVLLVLAIFIVLAVQVDDWSRDLNTNRAATGGESADPSLRSLQLSATADEVSAAIGRFAENSDAWSLGEVTIDDNATTTLPLVRTSALFRFADDVTVFLQATDSGTLVDVASQSRVGKGDLGQNPRNIRQLLDALRAEFE